jgi:flagellar basal-body rod modification protein FlgD
MSTVDTTNTIATTIAATTTATKTSRGTKIVQSGSEMDKNAFLRILTAELSNQDPENAKDSTAYVAQMAQFASIEQMTNLNANLTMSAANSMIGKGVVLKTLDSSGNQYCGILKAAYKQGTTIKVGVDVNNNGTTETQVFNYDDISGVTINPSDTSTLNNELIQLLTQASLIGKKAEFNSKDADGNYYSGVINGIVKNSNSFDLSVTLDNSATNEVKNFSLSDVKSINTVR